MKRRILLVLGGLSVGGAETYAVRLAKEFVKQGHSVDVILLSRKVDKELYSELAKFSSIYFSEWFPWMEGNYSNWLNAFIPLRSGLKQKKFDVVHVFDCLTLSFMFFNQKLIDFSSLSIGIYHNQELVWWSNKGVYFRDKMLNLLKENANAVLPCNELTRSLVGRSLGLKDSEKLDIVPIGICLDKFKRVRASQQSCKIISIGRLVSFKAYNQHVVECLSELRKRDDFHYYIYGEGSNKPFLKMLAENKGVSDYVHFMGEIPYKDFSLVLEGAFMFVGSGTSLIEASAAGVPSLIGLDSCKTCETKGLFSDVDGYTIHDMQAGEVLKPYAEVICNVKKMNANEYTNLSDEHRKKALQFDIVQSATKIAEKTNQRPVFDLAFNRWLGLCSFVFSVLRYGSKALASRFDA